MGFGRVLFCRGLQRLYTGTYIILQKTINGFLCLLIVFLKSKTHQLNLKDVIKLNRNLRQLIEIKLLLAIRTKWYCIYLIKAVFNSSNQQTVGSVSILTRRPGGGGHIQISFQLKSEWCQGPTEFTWPWVLLNRNLLVDRRLSAAASVCLSSLVTTIEVLKEF